MVKLETEPFRKIVYQVSKGDSIFSFNWEIKRHTDSSSLVKAYIKDLNNGFIQNVTVPFKKNEFVQRSIGTAQQLMNGLYDHKEDYKVTVESEQPQIVASQFCAYISLKSSIYNKGNNMIRNISQIMPYIRENNIPLTGDPFVQVTKWDPKDDTIEYDFCFPITRLDNLPPSDLIKFKNIREFSALKAIFNGNYRLSDRAWYELIDHASRTGVEVSLTPLEIFRNDPHSGGNELEWVAEVYLPIKDQP